MQTCLKILHNYNCPVKMLTKPKIQLPYGSELLKMMLAIFLSWVIICAVSAPLFPSLCEGSIEMTLAYCPLSWISLTRWPPCSSLKSQSRKTPALICDDGSACHPDSIWKTETSCLEEWVEPFMLAKITQQLLPSSKIIGRIQCCIASM